jgi:predicted nucleic acid-binding protein
VDPTRAVVLDTDIVSFVLNGDETVVEYIHRLQLDKSTCLFVSVVTLGELLSTPGLTDEERMKMTAAVKDIVDEVIEVDEHIAAVAGELRRVSNFGAGKPCPACNRRIGGKLKMPDALIAATAKTEGAELLTHNVSDYMPLSESGFLVITDPLSVPASAQAPREGPRGVS